MPARRRPHHPRVMPFSRLSQRAEVIALIAAGHNNSEISRSHRYSRQHVRKARAILARGGNPFEQQAQLGRPRKLTGEILARIDELSDHDVRRSDSHFVAILSEPPAQESYSAELVRTAGHALGYRFLPPITTFPLTEMQQSSRLRFARHHLEAQTDWSKALFVNETRVWRSSDHR
jgi:transposase